MEDMIEGLKFQLKQKDVDAFRLKGKIVVLASKLGDDELLEEGDKYGCGKDHDRTGYKGAYDDDRSMRSSHSNLGKSIHATPKTLKKSKAPQAAGQETSENRKNIVTSPLR